MMGIWEGEGAEEWNLEEHLRGRERNMCEWKAEMFHSEVAAGVNIAC